MSTLLSPSVSAYSALSVLSRTPSPPPLSPSSTPNPLLTRQKLYRNYPASTRNNNNNNNDDDDDNDREEEEEEEEEDKDEDEDKDKDNNIV